MTLEQRAEALIESEASMQTSGETFDRQNVVRLMAAFAREIGPEYVRAGLEAGADACDVVHGPHLTLWINGQRHAVKRLRALAADPARVAEIARRVEDDRG